MNYRKATLLAETNLDSVGTKTVDINVSDIISRITMAWRCTKSKASMDSHPHADITKIELVDGSEILHSLNGGENQALCIYDRKCPTMNHGQHMYDSSEYSSYGIDFGRFLFDPLYAFDPKKFTNPQLKITYNYALADTGVTSGNLEIWADMFDKKDVSPVGFLSAREIKDFTVATASVYDYVHLPVDRLTRKLFIQGFLLNYSPWATVIEARLSEDGDKSIPFDIELEDYYRTMKGVWTPIQEPVIATADNAGAWYYFITPTGYYDTLAISPFGDDYVYFEGTRSGGRIRPYAHTADRQFKGMAHGWLPNHVFEFAFGDPQDPADWYDLTNIGDLELRVKCGGTTGGHIRTFLQQVRLYS